MIQGPPLSTRYVFHATGPDGQRTYAEAVASNAAAARYRLETQGYHELELVQDEMDELLDKVNDAEVLREMPAAERAKFVRETSQKTLSRQILDTLKSQLWMFALLGISVWATAHSANPFGFRSWCIYLFTGGYLWLVVRGLIPMAVYNSLLVARSHERWDEALAIVGQLRSLRWLIGRPVPEYDLHFTEAKACAHRGDLAGALAYVQHLENDASFDRGLYYGLLAGVYETGRCWEEMAECQEKALALDPQSPTKIIDHAYGLIFRLRDVRRASAVLDQLDESEVKEMARGHYEFCRSLIQLEQGNAACAEAMLARAIEALGASAGNPIAAGFAQIIHAFHALALRELGRQAEADSEFAAAQPFLEEVGEVELLARWNDWR